MNDKRVMILSIALNVIIILVLLFVLVFSKQVKEPVEISTEMPTEISTEIQTMTPTATTLFKIKLDLEFDTADDLKWIQIFTDPDTQNSNSQETLRDGFIRLGGDNPYNSINVIYGLEPNQFVHFRTRPSENLCGFAGLEKNLAGGENKALIFEGCTGNMYNVSSIFNSNHLGSVFTNLQTIGSVPFSEDVWVDEIMWLNQSGDQLYYVVAFSDDASHVMYGSVALPDDWQYDQWGFNVGGWFDGNQTPRPYYDIDLIRVGSGSLKDYLDEYIPAYQEHQEELVAFLEKPGQPMAELHSLEEEGNETEEDGNENGSNGSLVQEINPEIELLTWPEPDSIIPYLVKKDDLAYCPNCEETVYGVSMAPFGYVFSVSYGLPPEETPANVNPCVKEWVQLYDRDISKGEILDFYKVIARIKQNGAGEPFQILSGGPESNLMLTRFNVLTNVSAVNTRNNYDSAMQIVKDTIASLPETGLAIPDLVAEPSTDFNEEAANSILETAWLATKDDPTIPISYINDRVSLWFRLKSPVTKMESAIYHPDTKTYLSYFWMDDPAVDTTLPLTSCISTKDVTDPNGYYGDRYGGSFLIRIWADGQLVAEIPAEGRK